jgi:uncharacterized DUF497 family protein
MGFQWDAGKSAANEAKHGLAFADAVAIFAGPVLIVEDKRREYGERRWNALGEVEGIVLHVTYTERDEDIRIISARRASRDERESYRRFRKSRAF